MSGVPVTVPGNRLLPQHAKLVHASGITDEVARARGYRSVTTRSELETLGFSKPQRRVPALLVPVWGVAGEVVTYQIRPDDPRVLDGKPLKYETPRGAHMALDVPPGVRDRLGDPAVPLFVTEGARKADAAVSKGIACIALLGVWNWRGSNAEGGKAALADWESVALNGRQVYVCFDSDVMTKPAVAKALERLKGFLESRKARVRAIYLSPATDGSKVGLDDFLASGERGVKDLLALSKDELEGAGGADEASYGATDSGLVWNRPTRDGRVAVPLTNFTATIVSDVCEDDGVEARRSFELEATQGERKARFLVSAERFGAMGWPAEHLGASAIVYAGQALRDHARVAIQVLSGKPPESRVFTHTGWRTLATGEHVYLSAARAIGSQGVHEGVLVRLPDALSRFELPAPPSGEALVRAVRASLGLLELAPARIAFSLVAAVFRAPLGTADFSVFLAGPSGVFKSELAALAQQHWGAGLDARHLPGSWASTGNSLEGLAFAAKDALMVVDDFAPGGTAVDVQRYHREADRLLRAQGNGAGRGRMRADGTLRPPKPPRGLMLSTGEDVPRGQSLRARTLVLELSPGDVSRERLSAAQRDAGEGRYAETLSSYVSWLAGRIEDVRRTLKADVEALRLEVVKGDMHNRTPALVADLAVGLRTFLEFANERGGLRADERLALEARGWDALLEAAGAQASHQQASEPARRFLDLVAGALAAQRAHVASVAGNEPLKPDAWGWRLVSESEHEGDVEQTWRAFGDRIGWLDGEDLYLEPEASFASAQRFANDSGERIPVSQATLKKRLAEHGYVVSRDHARRMLTVRRTLSGARRDVLHLRASAVQTGEPGATDPEGDTLGVAPASTTLGGAGPVCWSASMPTNGRHDSSLPTSGRRCDVEASGDVVGLVGISVGGETFARGGVHDPLADGTKGSETPPPSSLLHDTGRPGPSREATETSQGGTLLSHKNADHADQVAGSDVVGATSAGRHDSPMPTMPTSDADQQGRVARTRGSARGAGVASACADDVLDGRIALAGPNLFNAPVAAPPGPDIRRAGA